MTTLPQEYSPDGLLVTKTDQLTKKLSTIEPCPIKDGTWRYACCNKPFENIEAHVKEARSHRNSSDILKATCPNCIAGYTLRTEKHTKEGKLAYEYKKFTLSPTGSLNEERSWGSNGISFKDIGALRYWALTHLPASISTIHKHLNLIWSEQETYDSVKNILTSLSPDLNHDTSYDSYHFYRKRTGFGTRELDFLRDNYLSDLFQDVQIIMTLNFRQVVASSFREISDRMNQAGQGLNYAAGAMTTQW